ncbi:MAG: hypothetical protein ACYSUD_24150 [Planctomycetota bacterium]|jgi:hypothetical protein
MKKTKKCEVAIVTCALMCLSLAGCESLRFAPSESQKQNAWLHNRTVLVTAETARAEDASQKLQALTKLGEVQSRAFSAYYGMPKEFPQAETAEDILAGSLPRRLCRQALKDRMPGRSLTRQWSWESAYVPCSAAYMAREPFGS